MKQILDVIINAAHWDSGQDDSYAPVTWDFEKMQPVIGEYKSYPRPVVDESSSLAKTCFEIYNHNLTQTRYLERSVYLTQDIAEVRIGDTVRVNSGRKCPIGVIGEIVHIDNFGFGHVAKIRDAKNEYTVYLKNCSVLAVSLNRKPYDLKPLKEFPEIYALERAIL